MRSLTGLVIGTAGHIDHGKTSLVYALTGIDTDRLEEEKERGISIQLGFAEMQLPGGPKISFIDVPGHERFVRNMLAGAAGMEAVLLIVAANESVMPQTREHFEICKLLGLRHGLVALTKSDLATAAQRAQTRRDVEQLVRGSFLAGAPVIEVSTVTSIGLEELKRGLAQTVQHQTGRDLGGLMRLPIDRSFAVKGFGTVITGTLQAGAVAVGDTLELLPSKERVRVRGLQAQHIPVPQAQAGQRLAVNLTGIDHHAVPIGAVAVTAGMLACTRLIDIELQWLYPDVLPSPREEFILHIGSAQTGVRISLLRGLQPFRFARLRLSDPVVALPGDRIVLRRPSPAQTVGGGVVMDAFPPRRLSRGKTLKRLETLSSADLSGRIELLLEESPAARSLVDLIRLTGASRAQVQAAIKKSGSIVVSADERCVTRLWIEQKRLALVEWLREYHKSHPNAAGAPLAASRLGLDAALSALIFETFPAVRVEGELVSLAGHRAQFSEAELAVLQKLEQAFHVAGFQPPTLAEAIAGAGIEPRKARSLLESLVKNSRLIRLPGDLLFHADVIAHIRGSLAQHKGRRFSVPDFKQWTNVSRKFAIPLLEYLDQQRVTKRDGDMRVVL